MKNIFRLLKLIFCYLILPFVVGYIIPKITKTSQSVNIGDIKNGTITTNFQFSYSSIAFMFLFILMVIFFIYTKKHYKNSEIIKKTIIKGIKLYSVFYFFYLGMNWDDMDIFRYCDIEKLILEINFSKIIEYAKAAIFYFGLLFFIYSPIIMIVYLFNENKLKRYIRKCRGNRKRKIREENKKNEDDYEIKGMIASRKIKRKLFEDALTANDIILIDGEWGIGKTTFVNMILEKNKKKYHKINIDVMIFNKRERIKNEFVNQLKEIFKEEKIMFNNLKEFSYFMDFVDNKFTQLIQKNFMENGSFDEAKGELQKDFTVLDKEVVVVFDNLERILNDDLVNDGEWKEVISFIHDLADFEKLRVVIIADYNKLTNIKSKNNKKHKEYFDKFYDMKIEIEKADTTDILYAMEDKNTIKEELRKNFEKVIIDIENRFEKQEEMVNNPLNKVSNSIIKYEISDEYKKLREKYSSKILIPRVIEKIINFINSDKYNCKTEEFYLAAIFKVVYYEELQRLNKDNFSEKFGKNFEINYFRDFFNISFFEDNIEQYKKILFRDQHEESVAISKMEMILKNNKLLNTGTMLKYIKNFEIYNEIEYIDEKIKVEIYNIILRKIEELFEGVFKDNNKYNSKFIEIINNKVIWEMEDKVSKSHLGRVCKFIENKNIEIKMESIIGGIDFYIMRNFKEEYKLLLNSLTEFDTYKINEKLYWFREKYERIDNKLFPNYYSFISELQINFNIKIENESSMDNVIEKIFELINLIEDEKIKKYLKERFEIMFKRLKTVFGKNKDIINTVEDRDKNIYEEINLKNREEIFETDIGLILGIEVSYLKEIKTKIENFLKNEADIKYYIKFYNDIKNIEKNIKLRERIEKINYLIKEKDINILSNFLKQERDKFIAKEFIPDSLKYDIEKYFKSILEENSNELKEIQKILWN